MLASFMRLHGHLPKVAGFGLLALLAPRIYLCSAKACGSFNALSEHKRW